MESKLKSYDVLNSGRNLMVDIQPVTYAPFDNAVGEIADKTYPVCNDSNIIKYIKGIDSSSNISYYKPLLSAIQSISNIRKNKRIRNVDSNESKGARLQELEESIANLDPTQAEAVIQMANGVQRIRGLAGSGKTIVLALKVAYIHAQQQYCSFYYKGFLWVKSVTGYSLSRRSLATLALSLPCLPKTSFRLFPPRLLCLLLGLPPQMVSLISYLPY